MNESKLKHKILNFLNAEYPGVWIKIHGGPYQESGIPDIIGCSFMAGNGKFCGFEMKMPGNVETLKQAYQLRRIKKSGGLVGVVRECEDINKIIKGEKIYE